LIQLQESAAMINATSQRVRPRVWAAAACLIAGSMTLSPSPGWAREAAAATVSEQADLDVTGASVARIEATLGQLQTSDEAALHEPLLGMRRAELAFRASPDIQYEQRLIWWAGRFSELLAERVIPDGTRSGLAIRLAAYQHDALGLMDASLAAHGDLAAGDFQDGADHTLAAPRDEGSIRWVDWVVALASVCAAAWFRFRSTRELTRPETSARTAA
jgi:hypothetical protein